MLASIAKSLDGRAAAAVVGFACAGALAGYQLIPEPQARAAAPAELQLGGEPLAPRQGVESDEALRAARDYLRGRFVLQLPDREVTFSRAQLGVQVDVDRLREMVRQARDPRSTLRRWHEQRRPGQMLSLPVAGRLEGSRALEQLLRLKDQVDQRMRDARLQFPEAQVLAERRGVSLDAHATLDAVEEALFEGRDRVEAAVRTTEASHTAAQIRSLDMSQSLGRFETRYSTLEKDRDRSFNLKVAARAVDGLVVMPGETFDFNGVVGERSEANGFRVATVIASGQLVDGVGGGTCQIAGTLHAAAFFAGLGIVERSPHTRPSGYIKLGLDAVVSYPKLNLRLRNDYDEPVAISMKVSGGRVRAEIRGARSARRMVSFVRRIDEVLPYEQREREDPNLPQGVRVLSQRGVAGFKVSAFRVVRDLERNQAVRERRQNIYPPTTQVWRVGTGPAAPEDYEPPTGDAHGEYRADEYLVLTQGPGIHGTQERRRAGKTGSPGWTREQGLPQVD